MLPCSHVAITSVIMRAIDIKYKPVWLDYRLLIAGALLPDLVDKILLALLFRGNLFDGRYFGHTLIFVLVLGGAAAVQKLRQKEPWLLNFLAGIIIHNILDAMWLYPNILFWPLFGWKFTHPPNPAWLAVVKIGGFKIRQLVVWEFFSSGLILAYLLFLRITGKLSALISTGHIDME